jgi:hypothetical protein
MKGSIYIKDSGDYIFVDLYSHNHFNDFEVYDLTFKGIRFICNTNYKSDKFYNIIRSIINEINFHYFRDNEYIHISYSKDCVYGYKDNEIEIVYERGLYKYYIITDNKVSNNSKIKDDIDRSVKFKVINDDSLISSIFI